VILTKGQSRSDDGYSAFEGKTADGRSFEDDLRECGITHLYVGGLATDYCVRASVLDARRAGLKVTVLGEGIAGITEETTRQALDEMRRAGATIA
jgi:nicotinamidase/pyrazinamidase